MVQVFDELSKHSRRQPNLTRKKLREYSYSLARLNLPKELENYLLDIYNEEDLLDEDGHIQNYSEENIWYGVQKYIFEYARIKRQIDNLFGASEYLWNCSLTIQVQSIPEFLRWSTISAPQTILNENYDEIPF